MRANNTYKEYKNVQIQTANQGKLLIMLYEGCIKFLRLAKKSLEENNYEMSNTYISKAQNIISELTVNLDRENGGIIAENLAKLYDFMNRQLIQANVKKTVEPIEAVEELMTGLLEAWEQIINKKKITQNTSIRLEG
jgi:flagellar protein FliS